MIQVLRHLFRRGDFAEKSSESAVSLRDCCQRKGRLTVCAVRGSDCESRRLCELGLCLGRTITIVRPGNPAILEVDGSRFALSSDLMERVVVAPAHG
jgi:Fe2+ transport system protein FeoA